MYCCGVCGTAVIVIPGHPPIRGCEHDDAPIVAEAVARCAGQGGVT